MKKLDYDFIVAGSGAAGAAVASRLARAGARTLMLEQGVRAEPQKDGAAALARYYANSGLTAAFGNGLFPVTVGRTLGGTTTINSGTCLRPPREMLERWEKNTPGFSAEEFGERVEEAWTALKVKPVPRSLCGASTGYFLRGLERLGLEGGHLLERSEDGCDGGGRCCFVCPTDKKMTSTRAFIDTLTDRSALVIKLGCRLVSVKPAARPGGFVEAVIVDEEGTRRVLRCRGLVLSCGTLATPYFLRRLGLPAGDGLTIHPAAKVFALFDEPVYGWHGVPQAGGYWNASDPRIRFEGAFVPPEVAPLTMPLEGRRLKWWLDRYECAASFGFMVRDLGRGSVRYPLGPSLPALRYSLHDEDVRLLARGMKLTARAYFAAGAMRVLLPLNRPDNEIVHEAQLEAFDWDGILARQINLMGFHPLGTAGMGRSVGADLRAAEGVYVCDGSVVPESLGVNPQITIYAFALGLARRLLAGREAPAAPAKG
ncbi:MAG: GMC family oxidoreductase N-terminal domain-containing protein [Elusimicrobiota bacterium]